MHHLPKHFTRAWAQPCLLQHIQASFLSKNRTPNIMEGLVFYLFVSSNNATTNPDDTSKIGQLVAYYSCKTSQKTPPSQMHTIEIILFRLVQVVCGVISIFEVHCQYAFSPISHALNVRFSLRVLDLRSVPLDRCEKCV